MKFPESSGRQIRLALRCHHRDLCPALDRLYSRGEIKGYNGPHLDALWRVT